MVSLLVSLGLTICGKTWRYLARRVSHISLKLRALAIAGVSGLNRQNGLKGRAHGCRPQTLDRGRLPSNPLGSRQAQNRAILVIAPNYHSGPTKY